MTIADLIKLIQAGNTGAGNITLNINVNNADDDITQGFDDVDESYDDDDDYDDEDEDTTPSTAFTVGQRVVVCHIRHDGTRVHTNGSVMEVLGHDDKGYYTRVLGDNGKHYRTGLDFDQERLGSMIVRMDA